jgi:diadenosine tetraphosphate (Ap4A) HIT family hydrolase
MQCNDYHSVIEKYLRGNAETCSYCDFLNPLVLLRGEFLYITLAIGAFCEGYLQICTLRHRTASTGIDSQERQELNVMIETVRRTYDQTYMTRGIMFEHGQAGSCLWGEDALMNLTSLCHHMHIHCVPKNMNIHNTINKTFPKYFEVCSPEQMLEIRRDELGAEQYLFFLPPSGCGYMYDVKDITVPRQFLRTCVATELGKKELANWQTHPGIEYFEETKSKLTDVLTKNYKEFLDNDEFRNSKRVFI